MREFFRGILSSFEEERENHFVGRLPGVALTLFDDPGLLSFAPKGLAEKQPSEVTRVLAEPGFHWNRARQTRQ